ncbi:adenosine kinase isoform X2 [Andrena cerasifolii]|uniref:adenosine kinase isoform X2 n=1 Tax=Andrena cerasifolii TaxID=2819439 RepID=UPI0040381AD6
MGGRIPWRFASFKLKAPAIIAFGNPLLDVYVFLKNKDVLKKYDLMEDGEMELPNEKIQELLAVIALDVEQKVNAGGSAQNSMRILQWLFKSTFKCPCTMYCGGIGNDLRGVMLENLVRSASVDVRYALHPSLPTGQCIALINGSSRSLIANIGAAGVYTLDDLEKSNLPLDRNYHAAICEMIGHAKIVFGNARQMEALAQSLDIKYDDVTDIPFLLNSLKRIAVNVSKATNEDWLRHGGIFVMSQGESAPAITVWGEGQSVQVEPIKPVGPVVDTTGAGDALVAGFLAGVLIQWEPRDCLEYGCKVASFMVTQLGVTLPADIPPDLIPE